MDMREQPPAEPNRVRPEMVIGAVEAAQRLQRELAGLGIDSDVHHGHCLALVSVWSELVVWTDGRVFRWKSGRDALGRARDGLGWDAYSPADDPVSTARRVAARYAELRRLAVPPPMPNGWAPQ
ncbi:hypothetical protein [Streptosporangium sp. NPDC051022]|uniref:hypothetical protein n=1 Tax=Streptosporangium sp. NPDC051022 TaxID=3155752 RepID=UPI00341DA5CD